MTAPALTRSLELPLASLPSYRPQTAAADPILNPAIAMTRDRAQTNPGPDIADLGLVWGRLLELVPQGVVVVSRTLKPVYWNQKALKLSQALTDTDVASADFSQAVLPLAISEACHRLMRDSHTFNKSLILEHKTTEGHLIRISVRWLEFTDTHEANLPCATASRLRSPSNREVRRTTPVFVAVFLENCEEVMQQEMHIQQQKYDLTDREAEIWMLLRQECTYQDIAQHLQISLNTVKTHVKNIYAKRRCCQGKEKFWCQGG